MIRNLALVLVAAATILWGCEAPGDGKLPVEPPLFLVDDDREIDDGSGGGGSGGTTSSSWDGLLNFEMEGRTYYSGRRQLVSCDTLTLVQVVWDSFPPWDRIETKRRQCEDQPANWGGAVIATVTWNGTTERIAAFEADYEKMASEAYELDSGESLTLKLDADPYTWQGCEFRYFYAWNAGVHNYSDPAYFTMDAGDDNELISARFDCD